MTADRQRPGRPRDSRIDHTVLAATRELLAETGYAALTVDAVAARAGVGKAAIYRRYGSKAEMAFAAVVHELELPPPPDTGSLAGDLTAMARIVYASMSNPLAMDTGPALVAELAKDPRLVDRFQQNFLAVEREHAILILDRAVARGELKSRPDPDTAHLLLVGPQFYALYGFRLRLDDNLLNGLAAVLAAGIIHAQP